MQPLLDSLRAATRELTDVDLGSRVDRVHIRDLSPLQFATQYVARNKPVIIVGATEGWHACAAWDAAYLSERAGDALITVDLTSTGRADSATVVSICDNDVDAGSSPLGSPSHACRWFVTPCEVQMTVHRFFDLLRATRSGNASAGPTRVVPYVQHQNSSFTTEWQFLTDDVQPGLDWAEQVFGAPPEAVNLWIGDERSVTSFHKDHYENLYMVIRGTKVFHLLPPMDLYRLRLQSFPAAHFTLQPSERMPGADEVSTAGASADVGTQSHVFPLVVSTPFGEPLEEQHSVTELVLGQSKLQPVLNHPPGHVVWSDVEPWDPEGKGLQRSTSTALLDDPDLPAPLIAEVGPGETLYLPALWHHRVSQRCSEPAHDYVVAVNSWYPMAFDTRWASFRLAESVAVQAGLAQGPVGGDA